MSPSGGRGGSGILLEGLARAAAALVLGAPCVALLVGSVGTLPGGLLHAVVPSERQLGLLAHSVLLGAGVAGFGIGVGVVAATALGRLGFLASMARVLLPALVVVPPYVHALIWTASLFSFNSWLERHGLHGLELSGWMGCVVAESLALLPLGTGIALVCLGNIAPRLLEAGRVLQPELTVLRRLALPLMAPPLWAGAVLLLLISLTDFSVPSLFSVNVYSLEIYAQFSQDGNPGTALVTALPLLVLLAAVVLSGLARARPAASASGEIRGVAPVGPEVPGWFAAAQRAALLLLVAQLAVPVGSLAMIAGPWHAVALAVAGARQEIVTSVALASACALLSLPLGYVVALGLTRPGPGSGPWWALSVMALTLPPPLVGIGVLRLAELLPSGLDESWMPALANLSRFTPVAAFVLFAELRRVRGDLLDASRVFERSPLHGLIAVRLPLLAPGLALAGGVCFALTISEMGATLVVAPPGFATLVTRLYNLMHYGASAEVAALCLLLLAIALLASVVAVLAPAGLMRLAVGRAREPRR